MIAADRKIEEAWGASHALMESVKGSLIGRLVKRGGVTYKVTRAYLGYGRHIDIDGVRVNDGRVGKREFHIGFAILCEFLDEGGTDG